MAEIQIKPASELPDAADVEVVVVQGKRYVRWSGEDNVLYAAPHWVWMLYQQGRDNKQPATIE